MSGDEERLPVAESIALMLDLFAGLGDGLGVPLDDQAASIAEATGWPVDGVREALRARASRGGA